MTSRHKGRAVPERPADAVFSYLTTQRGLIIERRGQGWIGYWQIVKENLEQSLIQSGYSSTVKEIIQDWLDKLDVYDSIGAAAIAALERRFEWVANHDDCVPYDEYSLIVDACEANGMWIEEQHEVFKPGMTEEWGYGWEEQIGWGGYPTEAHAIAGAITHLHTLLKDAGVALPANTEQGDLAHTTDVPGFDEAELEDMSDPSEAESEKEGV